MARRQLRLLVLFCLCASGSAGFAQDSLSPANADKPAATDSKAPAKHSAHKKAAASAPAGKANNLQSAIEAEKAARLAEGRKKFFEQSDGFENKNSDMPFSLGNGGTPSAAFKF